MLLAPKHRVAFIHNLKTGGRSLYALLTRHLRDARVEFPLHTSAREARARIGRRRWLRTYSFAFIRNPWDRVVSAWMFDQQAGITAGSLRDYLGWCVEHGSILATTDQVGFLSDGNGILLVSEAFRFESFASECARLCANLGIPSDPLPRVGPSLHGHYSEYYTPETREIVAQWYARDIERFGYAFEEPA